MEAVLRGQLCLEFALDCQTGRQLYRLAVLSTAATVRVQKGRASGPRADRKRDAERDKQAGRVTPGPIGRFVWQIALIPWRTRTIRLTRRPMATAHVHKRRASGPRADRKRVLRVTFAQTRPAPGRGPAQACGSAPAPGECPARAGSAS